MFTVDELKTIRLALSSYPLSIEVNKAINSVDTELMKHNLVAKWVPKPKRPYQRKPEGKYEFFNIK